ncbi:anionic trypsin-2-like, partial [Coccinella septempunctata]|uniref:anionic trypsin-2-like n=1 Tax=Coccinella septempunctata TaxID=41139 RepID=UPI001D0929EC
MIHLVFFLTFLYITISFAKNDVHRVVGGFPCSTKNYKFVVSLQRRLMPYHFCGGSLIRLDFVLTAAHCIMSFLNNPKMVGVAAGVNTNNKFGSQRRRASKIIAHSEFDYTTMHNDIALILLDSPFKRSINVDVVNVSPKVAIGEIIDSCKTGTIMGFGISAVVYPNEKASEETYVYEGNLSCLHISPISNKKCESLIPISPIPGTFCAAYLPGGQDACKGDSGGPFVCHDCQIGVISAGFGCALPDIPGFYIRIDRYLDFINETMENNQIYRRGLVSSCDSADISINLMFHLLLIKCCMLLWHYWKELFAEMKPNNSSGELQWMLNTIYISLVICSPDFSIMKEIDFYRKLGKSSHPESLTSDEESGKLPPKETIE